jgi:hypothetical protein
MWRKKIATVAALALANLMFTAMPARAQNNGTTTDQSTTSTTEVTPNLAAPPPAVFTPNTAPGVVVTNTTYENGSHYLGLFGSGLTLFLASYVATVIANGVINNDVCNANATSNGAAATLGCRTSTWPLYVPLAGPWIQMGYLSGSNVTDGRLLLALDGVSQASGLVMMIVGAAARHPVNRIKNRVEVSPLTMLDGGGLSIRGGF